MNDVPIIERDGTLPDGICYWVLGAREKNGPIELVGGAQSGEMAVQMAHALIQEQNWSIAFITEQKRWIFADPSQPRRDPQEASDDEAVPSAPPLT